MNWNRSFTEKIQQNLYLDLPTIISARGVCLQLHSKWMSPLIRLFVGRATGFLVFASFWFLNNTITKTRGGIIECVLVLGQGVVGNHFLLGASVGSYPIGNGDFGGGMTSRVRMPLCHGSITCPHLKLWHWMRRWWFALIWLCVWYEIRIKRKGWFWESILEGLS